MIHQVEVEGKSYRQVAKNLCVDQSTVCRTVALFNQTGNVEKRKYPSNEGSAVLTDIDKLIILEKIAATPNIFLREIKEILINETGTDVSVSTIWNFLHVSNITRQKMVLVARQQDDFLRATYIQDMSVFSGFPEMFIFIDETGADRRNCMRRFGYSIRGKPAVLKKILIPRSKSECYSSYVYKWYH